MYSCSIKLLNTISFLISVCVSEDPDRIINTMNIRLNTKELWFNAREGQEVFLFPKVFKWAAEINHPPIEWELGAFFQGVK